MEAVTYVSTPSAPPLRTPLCDLLGILHPIVKAGMAGGTDTPELVAAVSAAGGLGVLGALGLTPDELRAAIRRVRDLTDRPFGVNVVVHPPEPDGGDVAAVRRIVDGFRRELDLPPAAGEPVPPTAPLSELLAVVFAERVPVLNTMGDPTDLIGPAHASGALVLAIVTTVAEAGQAVAAGADVVVAQGTEAGGLRGTFRLDRDGEAALIGTLALVPQVVDAVPPRVPVVAAGGIMDGRGLAAVLALGASGALMGTRFGAARESGIDPFWRRRLLAATETDTVISRCATGRPARALRNRLTDEFPRAGVAPLPFPRQAAELADLWAAARARGAADYLYLAAGQGAAMQTSGDSAAQIVAEVVAEARACLAHLGRLATETGPPTAPVNPR